VTRVDVIGIQTLLKAQQLALTHDERVATFNLGAIARHRPDVADRIVSAKAKLTIKGASTLDIGIDDPDWDIETSGILDTNDDRKLDSFPVSVDNLRFSLVKATRQDAATLGLTFEDLVVALLRRPNGRMSASRSKVTRAEFIERMFREIKTVDIPFWSPERGIKQPEQLPDYPDVKPPRSDSNQGFDKGSKFTVKGITADAEQRRQAATLMGVCDQEAVTHRVRVAILCAGIGESELKAVMNRGGSGYGGVLQGDITAKYHYFKVADTEGMARFFLKGGKGFQGGGAIALNREHPDWSPGHIAFVVEGDLSNFGGDEDKAAHFYDVHADEANHIISLWKGDPSGASDGTTTVLRHKDYRFTRGLPGKRESSWEAATRLADEVNWRLFAAGGVGWFVSDDYLISNSRAEYTIGDADGSLLDRCLADGLLEPPTYDWDNGKTAATAQLRVAADRWGIRPGTIVALRDMGAITGRWIVETVELDLLNASDTTVTLVKPIKPRKEPAAEVVSVTTGGEPGQGVKDTLAWARKMIGHFSDGGLANRGSELDPLEASFGFPAGGEPWCAMFATTALVHGGVSRDCRTAAVAQIRAWAAAGTHGYLKGFRGTPQPGDLVCYGSSHVGVVEKVDLNKKRVTTIEGNTSANKVTRRVSILGAGDYVRPDYPGG
jgi:hypothetical protein